MENQQKQETITKQKNPPRTEQGKKLVENYMKDLKESVYHGAVVSALAVGYRMLGKIDKNEPSISQ